MRVCITVREEEFDRLMMAWAQDPDLGLSPIGYLQRHYNIEVYDWDNDNNYRLWFKNNESAIMFRLKHG